MVAQSGLRNLDLGNLRCWRSSSAQSSSRANKAGTTSLLKLNKTKLCCGGDDAGNNSKGQKKKELSLPWWGGFNLVFMQYFVVAVRKIKKRIIV